MRRHARRMFRCGGCGALIPLVKGQSLACKRPECASELRLEWTSQMAAAYRVQLEHLEQGEPLEVRDGLLGNVYRLAGKYAEKWTGRQAVTP